MLSIYIYIYIYIKYLPGRPDASEDSTLVDLVGLWIVDPLPEGGCLVLDTEACTWQGFDCGLLDTSLSLEVPRQEAPGGFLGSFFGVENGGP